jgi:phosphatidylinositol 4-kinase
MMDSDGHILHIDFGFIFDHGLPLGAETAPFKLTGEMVELIGGKDSETFREFFHLFTRCFLAARARYPELEQIGRLLRDAGFSCFNADSFKNLAARFFLDRPLSEIFQAIEKIVYGSMRSTTTLAYDVFQSFQNNIFYVR